MDFNQMFDLLSNGHWIEIVDSVGNGNRARKNKTWRQGDPIILKVAIETFKTLCSTPSVMARESVVNARMSGV